MILTAYFDVGETFDNAETETVGVIGMGGYLATTDEWIRFGRRWRRVLRDNGLPYFRMSEFETGHIRGVYPYCTWTKERRLAVFQKLLRILGDAALVGTSSGIVRREFALLTDDEQARFGNVYQYFAASSMANIRDWLGRKGYTEAVDYVFELGDRDQGRFKQHILEAMTHAKFRRVFRVSSIDFKSKTDAPGLQAADFAAFELCKAVPRAMGADVRPRRKSLEAIVAQVEHIGGFLDAETLREVLAHKAALPSYAEWIKRP